MSESDDDEEHDLDPASGPREPLAAVFPPGLRAALADVDKIFSLVRREDPDHPSLDALHAWVRQRVTDDYQTGRVPPLRRGRALPPLTGRRSRSAGATGKRRPKTDET